MENTRKTQNFKSVTVEKPLLKELKKMVAEYGNTDEVSKVIGISTPALYRIFQLGICSGDTYNKILDAINETA